MLRRLEPEPLELRRERSRKTSPIGSPASARAFHSSVPSTRVIFSSLARLRFIGPIGRLIRKSARWPFVDRRLARYLIASQSPLMSSGSINVKIRPGLGRKSIARSSTAGSFASPVSTRDFSRPNPRPRSRCSSAAAISGSYSTNARRWKIVSGRAARRGQPSTSSPSRIARPGPANSSR